MSNVFEHHTILNDEKYRKYIFHEGMSRSIMLFVETVNICNNRCAICSYSKMTRRKDVMPMELYRKILMDYSNMGGGVLSLTPIVGEVFLDTFLIDRIKATHEFEKISEVNFFTNATPSDRFTDNELQFIVANTDKMLISIYGIDQDEYSLMTGRDEYARFINSLRRIVGIYDDTDRIRFHFRCLHDHTDDELAEWIQVNFGRNITFGKLSYYRNWGNTLSTRRALPLGARWAKVKKNTTQCLIPLLACQVTVDGKVSFCACADFDGIDELNIGDAKHSALLDIYNGDKTKKLWNFRKRGNMPSFCRKCTFHVDLRDVKQKEFMFENPTRFIGG
jgi:radical SAM protein with 4Fe4S-binding SPASM domain